MARQRIKTNTEILANGALEGLNYKSENVLSLIQNKALQSDLKSYLKAETDGQKAAWKLVRLLGKMSGEIKQDFGSDYAFADFMGMSQSVINKRKRLAEFAILLEERGYTDTKAFELLPLIKKLDKIEEHVKKLEAFKQVLEMISPDMTQKELREAVKNIDIEIEEDKIKSIESKNSDGGEGEEDIIEQEEYAENENNADPDGALLPLHENEMYAVTLPWLEDVEGVPYVSYHDYTVSGEVFRELYNAIVEVIGEEGE